MTSRVALITGASRGIGRGIAERLATDGARVAIADIRAEEGEETASDIRASGGNAVFLETDVTNEASVESAVKQTIQFWGGIDILVNNVGASKKHLLMDTTYSEWQNIIHLNLSSMFLCATKAYPFLKESRFASYREYCVGTCSCYRIRAFCLRCSKRRCSIAHPQYGN